MKTHTASPTSRKTVTLKVRVNESTRDRFYLAWQRDGADDFSEWARRVLGQEAGRVLRATGAGQP
jgi:hypothetical protein